MIEDNASNIADANAGNFPTSSSAKEDQAVSQDNPAGSTWLLCDDDELTAMLEEQRERTGQLPKIPRVPRMLYESNQKFYDPLMVSIGPYHHEKPNLKEMMNTKFTMLRQFVRDSGKSILELHMKVEEKAKEIDARQYYDESATEQLNDKMLIRMMVVDGCFIIQFFYNLFYHSENLKMNIRDVVFVGFDLFLLENQLPFPILRVLMSLRFREQEGELWMKLLKKFIKAMRQFPHRRKSCGEKISKFFRKRILPRALCSPKAPRLEEHDPDHLLSLFLEQFAGKETIDCSSKMWQYSNRPAMELRRVGIHFEPSKNSQCTDVRFKPTLFGGRLRLPPLRIGEKTKTLLLNLVAYETSLGDVQKLWVSSYLSFMDSLIDGPEDVRELCSRGILVHKLGSDQQVAELFNGLGKYLIVNPFAYNTVKRAIDEQCNSIIKGWVAEWKQTYFRSPWAFIAFVAAALGLTLTAISTYKDLFPTNGN